MTEARYTQYWLKQVLSYRTLLPLPRKFFFSVLCGQNSARRRGKALNEERLSPKDTYLSSWEKGRQDATLVCSANINTYFEWLIRSIIWLATTSTFPPETHSLLLFLGMDETTQGQVLIRAQKDVGESKAFCTPYRVQGIIGFNSGSHGRGD